MHDQNVGIKLEMDLFPLTEEFNTRSVSLSTETGTVSSFGYQIKF